VSQQINLFNPIFLKQKKHFSAVTMAQGLGLILIGAVAVSTYARLQLSRLDSEAKETSRQLKLTKDQLAKVSAAYAPREASKSLEDEIKRLDAGIKAQQQAFDIVQKGGFGNTKGYSEYLRAFSRQVVNGLWLTGFTIRGAGIDIELRGRATQPNLVPAYINRLKQEPIMKGKSFSTLAMDVPEVDAEAKPDAKSDKADQPAAGKQRVLAQYIEFVLKSSDVTGEGDAAASGASASESARALIGPQPSAGGKTK
jgi:hypothetical protein